MSKHGLIFKRLRLSGGGQQDALLEFKPGANIIFGASDTGKTLIFDCLDYMTGGASLREPERVKNYAYMWLELEAVGTTYTLRRTLVDNSISLFATSMEEISDSSVFTKLLKAPGKGEDLAGWLSNQIGFGSAMLVNREKTKSRSKVSIHTLKPLYFVSETDIIQDTSLLQPRQSFEPTLNRSAFKFLLTGDTDSHVSESESAPIKKAKQEGATSALEAFVAPYREELSVLAKRIPLASVGDIVSSISDTEVRIADVAESMKKTEKELSRTSHEISSLQDRITSLQILMRRFSILKESYESDADRLRFIIEGTSSVEPLDTTICPTCGQPFTDQNAVELDTQEGLEIVEVRDACLAEIDRIRISSSELDYAINDTSEELNLLEQSMQTLRIEQDGYLQNLNTSYGPELTRLTKLLSSLNEEKHQSSRKSDIERILDRVDLQNDVSSDDVVDKTPLHKVDETAIRDLCILMDEQLKSWNLDNYTPVGFDEGKQDFLLAGSSRLSKGKGLRAIVRASFVLALQELCRINFRPHPLVVVLDSPLTTFKGSQPQPGDDLGLEVESAFFSHLQNVPDSMQVIVLENKIPPLEVQKAVNSIEFTGNSNGRYGFLPLESVSSGL